ncbi:MAG TPA: hypothetical protein VMM36_01640 [Opitutaceae bacterium]|nr:hypothetical protein [Opitutaceae bacterium]
MPPNVFSGSRDGGAELLRDWAMRDFGGGQTVKDRIAQATDME